MSITETFNWSIFKNKKELFFEYKTMGNNIFCAAYFSKQISEQKVWTEVDFISAD